MPTLAVSSALTVTLMPNGLVRLTLSALRKGKPETFVSLDDLEKIGQFVEENLGGSDDDLEDIL